MDKKLVKLLKEVSKEAYAPEDECVQHLSDYVKKHRGPYDEVMENAAKYVESGRKKAGGIGIEAFFQQYGLDTEEGIAVMSLAESLLRIPDSETANEIIHDKLKNTDWGLHKRSGSSAMKASTFGLKTAGKLFELGNTVTKLADPVIRESIKKSMRMLGEHFVIGETINSAMSKAKKYEKKGYKFSYDMLGEGARSDEQAEDYMTKYIGAIDSLAKEVDVADGLYDRPSVSVKLSALHPRYNLLNSEDVIERIIPRLHSIMLHAKEAGIALTIDAEESERLDLSLEIFSKVITDEQFSEFEGVGIAVQAYHKNSKKVVDYIVELANHANKRIPVRLVKGAYWDSEIKKAQMEGLEDYPVFTQKHHTDIAYLACAYKLLQNDHYIYPQFATHNAITIAEIEKVARDNVFEFQLLYGMGNGIYDQLSSKHKCRIYVPVGSYDELLPYLIRRLLENSASTSFVRKMADLNIPAENITSDPLYDEPKKRISLPEDIFGYDRENSRGLDLGNRSQTDYFSNELGDFIKKTWVSNAIISGKDMKKGACREVFSPYDVTKKIGLTTEPTAAEIKLAMDVVASAHEKWSNVSVEKRTEVLDKMADLLEDHKSEAVALCVHEAGKTIGDSVAEVREAIDFCRYYALQAREIFNHEEYFKGPTGETNQLSLHSRGTFVCISPWNFPLAIFMGQIAAALATGNTVIAKPAESTTLIAHFAVKLLLKAGLPEDVIALLPGGGESIGKYLLNDQKTAGVVFTGSMETAKFINRTLSRRGGAIVPFIAETGGQNAMIVDSSALIEQTVDDILISAFGSAGQRCSALRVLYVQEDIADELLKVLSGAMAELKIGHPEFLSTDIGPVIDHKARDSIKKHIKTMAISYKLIASVEGRKEHLENGYFVEPAALEINSIDDLAEEVFGPVLHIIRYKYKNIDKVIKEINSYGYGLTLGIQSRIEKRCEYIRNKVKVGNIYVNRSMIGATVGVQPFGGEGLSGTGPKAGGPNYLMSFLTERVYTVNTTAIGGNKELLS